MMKKKILALALAAVMAGSTLMACGGGSTNKSGETKTESNDGAETTAEEGSSEDATAYDGEKVLNVYLAASPETMDPQKNSSLDGGNYLVHMYEGLYRFKNSGGGAEMAAAKDVQVSDDNLTYTYTLHDGLLWSDGEPVTAHDFEYAWKRLVDPATASPYAMDMGQFLLNAVDIIEEKKPVDELGVKALDDKTLEVKLSGPCAFVDEVFAFSTFMPVRQDMIEKGGDRWAIDPETHISNGAFQMTEFLNDDHVTVTRNTNYRENDTIIPDQINFIFMNDLNAELAAFRAGELDYGKEAPEEERVALKEEGVYDLFDMLGTYYLDMNNSKEPFDNPLVRKAFTLAIDPGYIANTVREGMVLPADSIVGPGFNDATEGSDFHEVGGPIQDISDIAKRQEEAKAALAEAGYPNGEGFPAVEYIYNTGGGHELPAQAMQQMWKDVLNVDVTLSAQEWGVFTDMRRQGEHQLARQGWIADYGDPSSMLNLFLSGNADGGNNTAQYKNPEFDSLMEIANTSADQAERMQAMHDAEKILLQQDYAIAPIFYYQEGALVSPELKDVGHQLKGYAMFHYAYKEDWK